MSHTADAHSEPLDLRTTTVVFKLDAKRWEAFMAALAKPPENNPRLRKLLARKPKWNTRPTRRRASGWA